MIFKYKVIDKNGAELEGLLETANREMAVSSLQRREYVIVSVNESTDQKGKSFKDYLTLDIQIFKPTVKDKDIVIFSRQIATMFEAGVQALKSFRLLAAESDNMALREVLTSLSDDLQSGVSLYKAFQKHERVFTKFYINLVKAGEEAGKLSETFLYLADYMERSYELKQKTKKALTYPAFVVATFIIIMTIMVIFVIPKMADMLTQQGQALPVFTQIVLGISNAITGYWYIIGPGLVGAFIMTKRWAETPEGRAYLDIVKLKIPVINNTYEKIFLARLADNLNTMLSSGVSIVNALEITAEVVDNYVYEQLILRVSEKVQNGSALSQALSEEKGQIPNIMIQMVKIGEETGELGYMLKNLSRFYKQEVERSIDGMVAMIEPIMILGLGAGVAILLSSVMMPMYNVATGIE